MRPHLSGRGRSNPYQEDYAAFGQLHDLTRERPGLSLWAVHHNRKDDNADDYTDAISGSTGITGAADHVAVLVRGRGEADGVVKFTSRDVAEHETAFKFDGGAWVELGDAARIDLSKGRAEVLEALEALDGTATLADLARATEKAPPTVLDLLRGLADDGLVRQEGARGPWTLVLNHAQYA